MFFFCKKKSPRVKIYIYFLANHELFFYKLFF
nr:MAG TPA: hypothetical protein [Caudoviricetes sp.]